MLNSIPTAMLEDSCDYPHITHEETEAERLDE